MEHRDRARAPVVPEERPVGRLLEREADPHGGDEDVGREAAACSELEVSCLSLREVRNSPTRVKVLLAPSAERRVTPSRGAADHRTDHAGAICGSRSGLRDDHGQGIFASVPDSSARRATHGDNPARSPRKVAQPPGPPTRARTGMRGTKYRSDPPIKTACRSCVATLMLVEAHGYHSDLASVIRHDCPKSKCCDGHQAQFVAESRAERCTLIHDAPPG